MPDAGETDLEMIIESIGKRAHRCSLSWGIAEKRMSDNLRWEKDCH